MDPQQQHQTPALGGLWSGSRVGGRRWQQSGQYASDTKATPPPAVNPRSTTRHASQQETAAGQHRFQPHDLQLKPGDSLSGVPLPLCDSSDTSDSSVTGSSAALSSGAGGAHNTGTTSPSSCSSSTAGMCPSSYKLHSEVHRGPRSSVWKATRTTTTPGDGAGNADRRQGGQKQAVVLKVLGLDSPQKQAAAVQELSIMQQLSTSSSSCSGRRQAVQQEQQNSMPRESSSTTGHLETSSDASSNRISTASSTTSSADTPPVSSHVVCLLGALLVKQPNQQQQQKQDQQQKHKAARDPHKQPQRQSQQQQTPAAAAVATPPEWSSQQQVAGGTASAAAAAAAINAAAAAADSGSGGGASAVVLVLPQLHQSLSWVLHWVHQRNGRMGLPDAAVRSFAYQLLSALAELHDQHALVHRDVKPSNLLLQQPFVVRTGKKHLMRSMNAQELSAAQWTLVDLGSAGRLLPPLPPPTNIARGQLPPPLSDSAATANSSSSSTGAVSNSWPASQHAAIGRGGVNNGGSGSGGSGFSWIGQLWDGFLTSIGQGSRAFKPAAMPANTPSGLRWHVAPGDMPAYESAAYTPPEAILHCPATAAYDIWSAACTIHEAATGRTLFPVEAAAAARRSITDRVYRQSSDDDDDTGAQEAAAAEKASTQLDEVHLALIKGVTGGKAAPLHLLSAADTSVAEALFADVATGRLWLSEEEEDVPELAAWRQRWCQPSLLERVLAKRTMTLQQALDLVSLLEPMLRWDPAARPTAAQLLQQPYFEPLKVDDGKRKQ